MISVLLLVWWINYGSSYNNFPSLITSNATMAVIIDKGFFSNKDEYQNATKVIQDLITDAVKKEMNLGSISIRVFRDMNVNFKGKFSIHIYK